MSYEEDEKRHEEQEMKEDRTSALVDSAIEDILGNSSEVERIIIENASDIARVYCLNEGKPGWDYLVAQQIEFCITDDAESTVEAREH